jgi:mannosyltransferase
MRPSTSRRALDVIILLAFAPRVFYLNARGLWYDEAFAILYASRSFAEMVYGTLTQVGGAAADVHPLFYYFSLHLWMSVAGDSAFAARLFSVFFGVATIPVVYRTVELLFDRRAAMATALIVALAPFHIAYSQESRMYAQLGFWSALALYGFVRYWQGGLVRWWWVFVIAGAGALYSHNLSAAVFAVLGAWVIFDALRTRMLRLLRATLLAGVAMLVLWLPWLVFVPSQFGKIEQAYWVPPPTVATLIQTLLVFAFDFDNAAPPSILLPILLFGALLIPTLVVYEVVRRARRLDQVKRTRLVFIATMAVAPIALLFAISQWHSVYIIRGLMPAFLWYAIIFGWALAGMPRRAGEIAALAFGAIVLVTLPAYYAYAEFPRSPFKHADQALRARVLPDDVIVHDNKLSFFPMYYYDPPLPQTFIADPPGAGSDTLAYPTQQALGLYATNLASATKNKQRVWFVIFQDAIDQSTGQGRTQPNLAWMEQHYHQVSLERFNDLNVYLFEQ